MSKHTRSRRAEMGAVLDALTLLVLWVDPDGCVLGANVAAGAALSGPTGGLIGRRVWDLFGQHSLIANLAARSAAEGVRHAENDVSLEGPSFSLGYFDLSIAPTDDPPGAVLTFIPKVAPRSDRSARATPPIARTLAHEIRNPLAGIRAAAQLIGKSSSDADTLALTQLICAEADRIKRLTDRVDALDSIEPPRLAEVNIHEAMDRARSVVAMSFPAIRFDEVYDPSLPSVRGDMDQLIQVFLNLAKNAAEAVRERAEPKVVFGTRFRPGLRVRSGLGAPLAQLEASIRDNGPGLPSELSGRLFEPFASAKPGGVGLGLAVAAEIVARHQGRIEVDSKPGDTHFRVLLPVFGAGEDA